MYLTPHTHTEASLGQTMDSRPLFMAQSRLEAGRCCSNILALALVLTLVKHFVTGGTMTATIS